MIIFLLFFICFFNNCAMEIENNHACKNVFQSYDLFGQIMRKLVDLHAQEHKDGWVIKENIAEDFTTIWKVSKLLRNHLQKLITEDEIFFSHVLETIAPKMEYEQIPFVKLKKGVYPFTIIEDNPQKNDPLSKKILLCAHLGTPLAINYLEKKALLLNDAYDLELALNPGYKIENTSVFFDFEAKEITTEPFQRPIDESLKKFHIQSQQVLISVLMKKYETEYPIINPRSIEILENYVPIYEIIK